MCAANITDASSVAQFLKDYKATAKNKKPYIVDRKKNQETLIKLGLTLTDQLNILLDLTVEDYVSGPDPDRDIKGDVWIFGKTIQTTELYIKIKLAFWTSIDTNEIHCDAKCISFHQSTEPLSYPLKS